MQPTPPIEAAEIPDNAVMLDVRTREGFASGHALHAVNVPLAELPDRLDDVPRVEDDLVVTCGDGEKAKIAATLLQQQGIAAVPMAQGMGGWRTAGRTIVI